MKIEKQSNDESSKQRGNNHKGDNELKQKQKQIDTKLNSLMTTKCYLIAFTMIFLAIGYPLILTFVFQRTSKNDSIPTSALPETEQTFYKDCSDFFRDNYRSDGIYEISPNGRIYFNVYCDMTSGGWTVIFRRNASNNKIEFQVPIKSYKIGFGDLNSNYFLGLDYIHLLTKDKDRQLIVSVDDKQFRYNRFALTSEFYQYKLIIDDEIDPFIDGASMLRLNNTRFSTIDVDYDLAINSNCSSAWKAGWWFTNCFDFSICCTCLIMHGNSGVKHLSFSDLKIK